MHYRVVGGEISNKSIEKMTSLVADKLDWTAKLTPWIFINEFNSRYGHVIAKCLHCAIVSCHDEIFIPYASPDQFERADKIQPPLLERF